MQVVLSATLSRQHCVVQCFSAGFPRNLTVSRVAAFVSAEP